MICEKWAHYEVYRSIYNGLFFGIDFIFFNGVVQKEMESQNKINILTDQTSKELLSSK